MFKVWGLGFRVPGLGCMKKFFASSFWSRSIRATDLVIESAIRALTVRLEVRGIALT